MKALLLTAALFSMTSALFTARTQQPVIVSNNPAGPISWTNNVPGHAYVVRVSTNLAAGWSNIALNIRPSTPGWTTNIGPSTTTVRFVSVVDTGRFANINAPVNLGTISGDTGMTVRADSGFGDAFYQFTITENDTGIGGHALSFEVLLNSPVGCDYDLYLYYLGSPIAQSTQSGTTPDNIYQSWTDTFGSDDARTFILEIRRFTGTSFSNWSLTITGNPPT